MIALTKESARVLNLVAADRVNIKTWVSCEPVIYPSAVKNYIASLSTVDLWRIGKLNHRKNETDWRRFGIGIEALCRNLGLKYVIKKDLRKAMEA